MDNILAVLKNSVSKKLISDISAAAGEPSENVESALDGIFSTLLLGMLQKVNEPDGIERLSDTLKQSSALGSMADDQSSLLRSFKNNNTLVNEGGRFLNEVLGDEVPTLISLLTDLYGIKNSSANSISLLATSLLTNFIEKKAGRESGGLLSLLINQKDYVIASAIPGLERIIRFNESNELTSSIGTMSDEEVKRVKDGVTYGKIGLKKTLMISVLCMHCCTTSLDALLSSNETDVANHTHLVRDDFIRKKLPNGTELDLPRQGMERKLLTFIGTPAASVNEGTWFSCDQFTL